MPLALFTLGFRPFFLAGSVYAVISMLVWVLWLAGAIDIPSDFDPLYWHQHEFLFGVTSAIIAGFLLTSVPNWTARPPLSPSGLAVLLALWGLGRCLVLLSGLLPFWAIVPGLVAFPAVLVIWVGQMILGSGNRKNIPVFLVALLYLLAYLLFLYEGWYLEMALYGQRLAIAAIVMLIIVIGGRVVPNFTTNWLRKENKGGRMPAPFDRFDMLCLISSGLALVGWSFLPAVDGEVVTLAAGGCMGLLGLLHLARLYRWVPWRTFAEPLVTILHVGYVFVPLGFLMFACAFLLEDGALETGAMHGWTVGAIGVMTLAIMTRATRGHTGRSMTAPWSTVLIYVCLVVAALSRIAVPLFPDATTPLLHLSATGWILGYGLFAILYGPALILPRKDAA